MPNKCFICGEIKLCKKFDKENWAFICRACDIAQKIEQLQRLAEEEINKSKEARNKKAWTNQILKEAVRSRNKFIITKN